MSPNMMKWKYALMTTILFVIVTNPYTYKLVDMVSDKTLGVKIADDKGAPTSVGLAVHTVVFFLALRVLMMLKKH